MKKESRDRLLDTYDHAFELLGLTSFAEGLNLVRKELEKAAQTLRMAKTRQGLEAHLAKDPEPSPEQLEATLRGIRLLPYQIRKILPQAAMELTKKLPHDPGGRPSAINSDETPRICEEIGKLLGQGLKLIDAQRRVAQRQGVRVRTIQRAWQKRKLAAISTEDTI